MCDHQRYWDSGFMVMALQSYFVSSDRINSADFFFYLIKCNFTLLSVILGILLGVLLPRESLNSDDQLELPESSPWYGNEEIKIFRQYLRIPTVYPDIDYGKVI